MFGGSDGRLRSIDCKWYTLMFALVGVAAVGDGEGRVEVFALGFVVDAVVRANGYIVQLAPSFVEEDCVEGSWLNSLFLVSRRD